jgi:predicted dehydrogenase
MRRAKLMQKRRGIVLGCGAIAREHLFALQFSKDVEVVAVCDLSTARAESIAERYRIPAFFTSHTEMLSKTEADFVHITTPPQSHFTLSRDCLEAGFNVICEKPITQSFAEFEILRDIAAHRNLVLIENQNYRTHSTIRQIKAMVDKGELGEIIEVQVQVHMNIHAKGSVFSDPNLPHFSATMKGGVAGDFLTHMTYIAQMFIGYQATATPHWSEHRQSSFGKDEFRAVLQGESARAYLSFSGNAQPIGFWLKVIGTEGQAEANLFEGPRLTVRRPRGGGPLATFKDGLSESKAVLSSTVTSLYRKFSGAARYDGLQQFLESAYGGLEDRTMLPVSIEQLEATTRIVDEFCTARGNT